MVESSGQSSSTTKADVEKDGPLMDGCSEHVKRLVAQGKENGYVTYDEVSRSLISNQLSSEQIEDVLATLSEMGVNVIESEDSDESEDTPSPESAGEDGETRPVTLPQRNTESASEDIGRTDDPVRMYLREMGGVELLSRRGEIVIAKRIEAGLIKVTEAICSNPLTFRAIVQWHNALVEGRMLLRDIVDLDLDPDRGIPA